MKKTFLTLVGFLLAFAALAQKEVPEIAKNANTELTTAQKATIEWVKLYDLSSEQAIEALKIQKTKYQNLADIEPLKTQNADMYVKKRLSSFELANSEFMNLLDERQLKIFKQKDAERTAKYETIVTAMKKTGYSEEAIQQKLMETEF